jgi:hypothetical protein
MPAPRPPIVKKVGWRKNEFAPAIGLQLSRVNELLRDGTIPSVKVFGARIITVSPAEFLARFANPEG